MALDFTLSEEQELLLRTARDVFRPFRDKADELFERVVNLAPYLPDDLLVFANSVRNPGHLADIIASTLTLTELLPAPIKVGNLEIINIYNNLNQHLPNLKLVNTTRTIAFQAAYLRATYNIKTPDALHLATAIEHKVDAFYTSDKNLTRVAV